jgi:hypothetical protein
MNREEMLRDGVDGRPAVEHKEGRKMGPVQSELGEDEKGGAKNRERSSSTAGRKRVATPLTPQANNGTAPPLPPAAADSQRAPPPNPPS